MRVEPSDRRLIRARFDHMKKNGQHIKGVLCEFVYPDPHDISDLSYVAYRIAAGLGVPQEYLFPNRKA